MIVKYYDIDNKKMYSNDIDNLHELYVLKDYCDRNKYLIKNYNKIRKYLIGK